MVSKWTHDQLEGFMGQWFVDRGWVPAIAELDVGYVKDGGDLPRWAKDDDDYFDKLKRWHSMSDERARQHVEHAHDRGWIADVAGLVIMSRHCLRELRLEHLRDFEFPRSYLMWLCEVKVERSDFTKDDKFGKPPQAHIQLLAVPKGLISLEEIPQGWGLLEVSGDRVYKNMDCMAHHVYELPDEVEHNFMQQMVWTMWWRHHKDASRAFSRKLNSERALGKDAQKVSKIIEATLDYVAGKGTSLEERLQAKGIRRKPRTWTTDRTNKFRKAFTKKEDLHAKEQK